MCPHAGLKSACEKPGQFKNGRCWNAKLVAWLGKRCRHRKGRARVYAGCPELKGCQSQGLTLEEVMTNIKEAAELYLETLPPDTPTP
jgi:hypothetical protein